MNAPHVVFFRGMNTYGHDHAQLSIVRLGPMFKHVQRELTARGVHFYPVLGMGAGTWPQVAERAQASLEALPIWKDPHVPVHFVGHSAGGVVARVMLDRLGRARLADGRSKIASLLSVASPHRGSGLARVFCEMPERHRGSAAVFRTLGYDLESKLTMLATMLTASIDEITRELDAARFPGVRTGSVVCAPPRRRWSKPMRAFYLLKALRSFDVPSDGIIERSSQIFGDEVFDVELDHFQQAGFFGAGKNFVRMCDVLAEFTRRHDYRAQIRPAHQDRSTPASEEVR